MISFRDVTFSYSGERPILDRLNLDLFPGLTLLLGPNGCGKSTFMKIAAGVEKPEAGRIEVDGADMWKEEVRARMSLAYLPEHPDLTPYATLEEIITLVCRLRGESPETGRTALDVFGLGRYSGNTVRELSMGQRRRALFAATTIGNPQHILLDEPLDAMDVNIREDILDWIERRRAAGCVMVVVSHTLLPFVEMADRAVTLLDGKASLYDELPGQGEAKCAFIENLARS